MAPHDMSEELKELINQIPTPTEGIPLYQAFTSDFYITINSFTYYFLYYPFFINYSNKELYEIK